MAVIATTLMSAISVGFSSTVRLTATVGLLCLVNLRRRSLWMRLRLRTVLHPRLRLHRAVLSSWSLHPLLRLRLRHRAIFYVRLRLWLRVVFESRLCSVRLRLHRAVLAARSFYARLRLWLRPILKPRLRSVWLRLTVLKRWICNVRLRLRPVLETWVAIGLRLRGTILHSRLVPIGLSV